MTLFIIDLEEIKSYSFHFALDCAFDLIQTRIFCIEHTLSTLKKWGFVHDLKVLYEADPGKRHMFWGWTKRNLCQWNFCFWVFVFYLQTYWGNENLAEWLKLHVLFCRIFSYFRTNVSSPFTDTVSLIWFICTFPGIWCKN